MKKEHVIDLLPEYLDNILPETKSAAVEKHLSACTQCQKELEELKILFKAIADEPNAVPSDRLRNRFEKALELEKATTTKVVSISEGYKKSSWASNMLKVAASIALLVASFQMGSVFQQKKSNDDLAFVQNESLQLKQTAMLSLMENQSASKRIQGVNYIEEFPNPDEAIVKALTNRLRYDENDNVRLNAFEALSKFTSSETVKTAFIEALGTEKNPSIQIAIIQALVQIQEKKAIGPMQKLLEREDTQPFIKNEIKLGLPKII
ncbi:HEAT repeat domain-containing protein [Flagellimonas pacifica]|uniref:Putative zinc-finger n=1 Tax=Flagellimonas pacifica TaxID=1247520 RepID=A0A285MIC5_9FLAO|nr:HEAT repeat domain-containing protein [Allomuricauda parva]SNY95251.1 Putative zinc-finger [Allomuricauda parva]